MAVDKKYAGIKVSVTLNTITFFYVFTKNIVGKHYFFYNSSYVIAVNFCIVKLADITGNSNIAVQIEYFCIFRENIRNKDSVIGFL